MYQELSDREKQENPSWLFEQARALLTGYSDPVANAANLSALLFHTLEDVNWAGFYFFKGGRLIVGPYQGKPACVEIPLGKGVCGTAAASRQIQCVADVDSFEGHIACDTESRSEIVVPLVRNGELLGVLDIDSPLPGRFGPEDEKLLQQLAELYVCSLDT